MAIQPKNPPPAAGDNHPSPFEAPREQSPRPRLYHGVRTAGRLDVGVERKPS